MPRLPPHGFARNCCELLPPPIFPPYYWGWVLWNPPSLEGSLIHSSLYTLSARRRHRSMARATTVNWHDLERLPSSNLGSDSCRLPRNLQGLPPYLCAHVIPTRSTPWMRASVPDLMATQADTIHWRPSKRPVSQIDLHAGKVVVWPGDDLLPYVHFLSPHFLGSLEDERSIRPYPWP